MAAGIAAVAALCGVAAWLEYRMYFQMVGQLRVFYPKVLAEQGPAFARRWAAPTVALMRPGWEPIWLRAPLRPVLVQTLEQFAGPGLMALTLAARGRRWLWVVPPALWIASVAPLYTVSAPAGSFAIEAFFDPGSPEFWVVLLGGFGLALVPALAIALHGRAVSAAPSGGQVAAEAASDRPGPDTGAAIAAIGLTVALLLLACWAIGGFLAWTAPLVALGPPFLFGGLLGSRPRWAWALVVAPLLTVSATPGTDTLWNPLSTLPRPGLAAVLVGAAVLGASWEPLARLLGRLERAPLASLVALNALNVADALLTRYALRSEGAVESNPVVRLIGVPGKLVAVALLGWLLYRTRPRALVWPVVAFAVVIAWQLAGAYVNAHT